MLNFRRTALLACITTALWAVPLVVHAYPADIQSPFQPKITNSAKIPATPDPTAKPSSSMNRSEKSIAALLLEQSDEKQAKMFSSLIKPRLLYATARSLCGRENGWLAFVDIYQNYMSNKPDGFKLQQSTVQYGLQQLPKGVESVTLSIGSTDYKLERDKRMVFRFPVFELGKDALSGAVDVAVILSDKTVNIPLEQEFPGTAPSIDKALSAMAPAYVAFAQDGSPLPIDHAFLRLRSYVRNMTSLERSYVWELYLVHDVELPAKATVLRWDVFSNSTSVCLRELNEYF